MTRNEMIAEKMGWTVFKTKSLGMVAKDQDGDGFPFMPESITADTPTGHWLAHLLIGRMVDDGFRVKIWHTGDGVYADATSGEGDNFKWYVGSKREGWDNTEPAAIVELFCTVYGIGGE
jgi:hypothetical protein